LFIDFQLHAIHVCRIPRQKTVREFPPSIIASDR
jgi:hypothetical protein